MGSGGGPDADADADECDVRPLTNVACCTEATQYESLCVPEDQNFYARQSSAFTNKVKWETPNVECSDIEDERKCESVKHCKWETSEKEGEKGEKKRRMEDQKGKDDAKSKSSCVVDK